MKKLTQRPAQDKGHPLLRAQKSGDRTLTALQEDVALQVCEAVACGHTLDEVCKKENEGKFPSYITFIRWMLMHPHVKQAYEAALELRTFAMEDEAITAARGAKASTAPAVRVLLSQLQWSMERGNAQRFGQKGVGQVTVPIQINTTMNLGQADAPAEAKAENIYKIEAQVPNFVDLDPLPAEPDNVSVPLLGGKGKHRGPQKAVLTPRVLEDGSPNPEWEEQERARRSAVGYAGAQARWAKGDEDAG